MRRDLGTVLCLTHYDAPEFLFICGTQVTTSHRVYRALAAGINLPWLFWSFNEVKFTENMLRG